jgi:hypothetical protein
MPSSLGAGYTLNYRKGPSQKDGPLVCTHYYTFKTKKNKRYMAEAEQYQHHIYVIKFYPLAVKASSNRYKLLTGDGGAGHIITTCIRIFLDIYNRDPLASAGFIGEASIGEEEENTKRFQVYIKAAGTFIGTDKFKHHANSKASSYFIESLTNTEPNLKELAEEMFNKLYVMPRALQPAIEITTGSGG